MEAFEIKCSYYEQGIEENKNNGEDGKSDCTARCCSGCGVE